MATFKPTDSVFDRRKTNTHRQQLLSFSLVLSWLATRMARDSVRPSVRPSVHPRSCHTVRLWRRPQRLERICTSRGHSRIIPSANAPTSCIMAQMRTASLYNMRNKSKSDYTHQLITNTFVVVSQLTILHSVYDSSAAYFHLFLSVTPIQSCLTLCAS